MNYNIGDKVIIYSNDKWINGKINGKINKLKYLLIK